MVQQRRESSAARFKHCKQIIPGDASRGVGEKRFDYSAVAGYTSASASTPAAALGPVTVCCSMVSIR